MEQSKTFDTLIATLKDDQVIIQPKWSSHTFPTYKVDQVTEDTINTYRILRSAAKVNHEEFMKIVAWVREAQFDYTNINHIKDRWRKILCSSDFNYEEFDAGFVWGEEFPEPYEGAFTAQGSDFDAAVEANINTGFKSLFEALVEQTVTFYHFHGARVKGWVPVRGCLVDEPVYFLPKQLSALVDANFLDINYGKSCCDEIYLDVELGIGDLPFWIEVRRGEFVGDAPSFMLYTVEGNHFEEYSDVDSLLSALSETLDNYSNDFKFASDVAMKAQEVK